MLQPKLDYYYGRRVEAVGVEPDVDEWDITLEGGVVLRNHDPQISKPRNFSDLTGTFFLRAMFSEGETRVQFGHSAKDRQSMPTIVSEITLNPLEYSIEDPAHEEAVFPQRIQGREPVDGDDIAIEIRDGDDIVL